MTPNQKTLCDLITSRGLTEQATAAVAGDADAMSAVLDDLNTPSITKTDEARKIKDDLIDAPHIGATKADIVLGSLWKAGNGNTPGFPAQLCLSEWHALNGVGTNVARPGVQALIGQLAVADSWPDGLAESVKQIGVWLVSPAEDAGLPEVTAEHVTAAQTSAARQAIIDALRPVWVARSAVVEQALHDGTITTLQQIVAVIGGT